MDAATTLPAWIQAGGVVTLAIMVWLEQREIKRLLAELAAGVAVLKDRYSGRSEWTENTNPAIPRTVEKQPSQPVKTGYYSRHKTHGDE